MITETGGAEGEVTIDENGLSSLVDPAVVKMETPFEGKRKPSAAKISLETPTEEQR